MRCEDRRDCGGGSRGRDRQRCPLAPAPEGTNGAIRPPPVRSGREHRDPVDRTIGGAGRFGREGSRGGNHGALALGAYERTGRKRWCARRRPRAPSRRARARRCAATGGHAGPSSRSSLDAGVSAGPGTDDRGHRTDARATPSGTRRFASARSPDGLSGTAPSRRLRVRAGCSPRGRGSARAGARTRCSRSEVGSSASNIGPFVRRLSVRGSVGRGPGFSRRGRGSAWAGVRGRAGRA